MRLVHADLVEAKRLTGPRLTDAPDVARTNGGHFRIAACGLAVDEEHDRLPVAVNLDGPERDPVRHDVVAARVRDPWPTQARAHPIRLRQHLVPTAEQRLKPLGREAIGLRTEDRADRRLTGVVRDRPPLHAARRDGTGWEHA